MFMKLNFAFHHKSQGATIIAVEVGWRIPGGELQERIKLLVLVLLELVVHFSQERLQQ